MAKRFRHAGAFESGDANSSYTDTTGAYMDYDGASYAQFGAKASASGSLGTKIRTMLSGVVKDAIIIAASGLTITLLSGSTLAAQAITAANGVTVSAGGLAVNSGTTSVQALTVAGMTTNTSGNNQVLYSAASATTGYQYFNIQNTTGRLILGVEGSSAGTLLTNGSAYATILSTATSSALDFGTNNTRRGGFSSAGAFDFASICIHAASTTSLASVRIPSGTAPSAPTDGDMWYDGTNVKFRVGGTTKTFTLT